jgi:hypothetical protein
MTLSWHLVLVSVTSALSMKKLMTMTIVMIRPAAPAAVANVLTRSDLLRPSMVQSYL